MMQGNEHVLMQDVRVVQHIDGGPVPDRNVTELLLPEDRGVVGYRQRTQEWAARGWRIDTEAIRAGSPGKDFYVIPSPQRRESGNWVFNTVPLIPAGSVATILTLGLAVFSTSPTPVSVPPVPYPVTQ